MENIINYKIDSKILNSNGDRIIKLLIKWLVQEGFDVDVYTLCLDEVGDLMIDFEFSNANPSDIEVRSNLFFEKMNIDYAIEK